MVHQALDEGAAPVTNVLFDTLWHREYDGWSICCRSYARAMAAAGMGVQLHSWLPSVEGPANDRVTAEIGHLLKPIDRDLFVFSCTFNGEWGISYSLEPLVKARKPRAFFTMFERLRVEPAAVSFLRELDGVWVPSTWNAEFMRSAGVDSTVAIGMPYHDDDPHLTLPPPKKEPRTFLWIGRWEPRKAPHNLIRAFLRAFKPGEAELVLKPGPLPWEGDYSQAEDVIRDELELGSWKHWKPSQATESIRVVRGLLSPAAMIALHASSDVYVSASRGEGIDLPIHAAKLGGRRVVTTDSGGPRDFLTESDILVPSTGTVPADPLYKWGAGATYADYSLDALVAAMQVARAETRRPERLSTAFHASVIGARLRSWAEEILSRVPTEPKPLPQLTAFAEWLEEET